jgi:ABC-type uncharacterized transport system auxiliary subunit
MTRRALAVLLAVCAVLGACRKEGPSAGPKKSFRIAVIEGNHPRVLEGIRGALKAARTSRPKASPSR